MPPRKKLSEQIRRAVRRSGRSTYALASECDINRHSLYRFMRREGGMHLEKIDRLADRLGLEVTTPTERAASA